MMASMSWKGNCYDNAPMKSFWGVLKSEQIHHCRYATRQEAIQDIKRIHRDFLTGRGNMPGSGSCLPQLLNDGSIKNGCRLERFGVHY
jgi:transposase InsO family protein